MSFRGIQCLEIRHLNQHYQAFLTVYFYRRFKISCNQAASTFALQKYMEYLKVDNNPDDLLRYQDIRNLIQTQIVDYLIY